ncbi:hypothetical protein CQ12_41035 [Bradyrhizobium jicamae]|uniref:Uncharacterized protein n=1 Tax=Bradyrhizobium jicamae TaxID=280332 RepID=A0A0R3LZA6_9BRAD|nr:hypothetical protein [Bradyrhizobium jicamae]KRR10949.1 hypothetical protein CQ12_41035 [Bradyrhizobium jicamae]
MSLIGTALFNSFRSVARSDFCVGGTREIFMSTIDVDSVGKMAFPILPILVAIAGRPFGRGEATEVDKSTPSRSGSEPL